MKNYIPPRAYGIVACLLCLLLFTGSAHACAVPVYRYALERWSGANYQVLVFHKAPLTMDEEKAVSYLESKSASGDEFANLTVHRVDLTQEMPASLAVYKKVLPKDGSPVMVIRYPKEFHTRRPLWMGPPTMESADKILSSPAREEIIKRITDGEAVVWVVLDGKDPSENRSVKRMLKKQSDKIAETYNLGVKEQEKRVRYSILDLGRDHMKLSSQESPEHLFLSMLMYSERDLFDFTDTPLVFPVFGRGRSLYAIGGKGLTPENIEAACNYLNGACSCEVKDENPGADLMFAAEWGKAITRSWVDDEELSLLGMPQNRSDEVPDLTGASCPVLPDPKVAAEEGEKEDKMSSVWRNMLLLTAAFAAALIAGCILIGRRRQGFKA